MIRLFQIGTGVFGPRQILPQMSGINSIWIRPFVMQQSDFFNILLYYLMIFEGKSSN